MSPLDKKSSRNEKKPSFVLFSHTVSQKNEETDFTLSSEEKKLLLTIARDSINYWMDHRGFMPRERSDYPDVVKKSCGAFVTLHKNGKLRGCIGRFMSSEPLYSIVEQMAVASAFNDYRFEPVEKGEMTAIDIEISVLTPLKRIQTIEELQLGKHGIYIKKGFSSGTFLPQVAQDTGWSKEEFLGHCSRDKAGIGWDGWKDAELYTYEALVFGENER